MSRTVRLAPVILLPAILFSTSIRAQTFIRAYGSASAAAYAYAIDTTRDGGYVLAGEVITGGSARDLYVLKLYPSGAVAWQKRYATDTDDMVHSIRQTPDGGYIVAAEEGHVTGHIGGFIERDFWVLKLDADGAIEWENVYGGSDDEYIEVAKPTRDGGYIVAGSTVSFQFAGTIDAWLVKLDASGQIQWQKAYGGPGSDHFWDVAQLDDGGYVLAGQTDSYGAGGLDMWVVRLDAAGGIVWQKAYGGSAWDRATSIDLARDGSGDFIVGGTTASFGGTGVDLLVMRLHPDGTQVWNRRFDGAVNATSPDDEMGGVAWLPDNTVLVAGSKPTFASGYEAWLLKLSNGTVAWERTYGGSGSDQAFAIRAIPGTNAAVMGGSTTTFAPTGTTSAWALRLDPTGNSGSGCTLPATASVLGHPAILVVTTTTAAVADTPSGSAVLAVSDMPVAQSVADQCIGAPAEVSHAWSSQPLTFSDRTTLQWEAGSANGASTFDLYRGTVAGLPASDYGTCLQNGLTAATAQDAASPPPGVGWTYLVTGKNGAGEGSLGVKSDGSERPNSSPCP